MDGFKKTFQNFLKQWNVPAAGGTFKLADEYVTDWINAINATTDDEVKRNKKWKKSIISAKSVEKFQEKWSPKKSFVVQ